MRSLMRKYLLLFIFVVATTSFAQTLTFCEKVSEKGSPINEATVFNIPKGGGYFYFLVNLPYTVGCEEAYFDIYRLDNYDPNYPSMEGEGESFETTISTATKADWVWFYKQVTFYKTGYYRVYVRDCGDSFLASGVVQIKLK